MGRRQTFAASSVFRGCGTRPRNKRHLGGIRRGRGGSGKNEQCYSSASTRCAAEGRKKCSGFRIGGSSGLGTKRMAAPGATYLTSASKARCFWNRGWRRPDPCRRCRYGCDGETRPVKKGKGSSCSGAPAVVVQSMGQVETDLARDSKDAGLLSEGS